MAFVTARDVRLAVILSCLALPALLAQQDMGVITGLVTDSSGAAVPRALITVTNTETNEVRTLQSSANGIYTAGPLRIGLYQVAVEHSGFKRVVISNLRVSAQDRVRADVELTVGQIAESVSVSAEAPLLRSETSSLDYVVGQKEMRELPLNGRNFQQLAWLTSGVIPSTRSRDRESGFNAHGQPMTQNSFIIDGIDNNNNVMGMQDRKMQVVAPSLDAVAEFKVQTSNFSAEFGRNSGAVMIVNIKHGTNQFRGTAYNYLRNDATDARDMFTYVDRTGDGRGDPEVLKQNQFGATFGGPILRDKTFFFASFEGRRERRSQTDTATVPTAEERNGIFSPALVMVRDPLTNQNFPGNTIPRSRFDSTAASMLELWPQPNFPGFGTRQNFVRNPPWNATRDQYDFRLDHNLSEGDKIFGRFSLNRFDNLRDSVFEAPARGGQNNDRAFDDNDARSVAFSYTRILRPTLINEFRYGFSRQKVDKRELSQDLTSELNAKYGIKGIPASDRLFGLPNFNLAGALNFTGLGEPGSMPNFKIHQVHQYLNNLSWNRGSHNFKFGGDLRWNRSDIFGGATGHGNLSFNGNFTRISFGDFLLGWPNSAALTTFLQGAMRFRNYMFYALDDFKVTPRLTVNLGIRYELISPWLEKYDSMNRLDLTPGPAFGSIVYANACESWSCRGLVQTDTNNWAPRIGFAYQVTGRTIFRASAGIFYGGQGALGADARGINNWPYNRSVTAQSTPTAPALQLSAGYPADFLGSTTVPPQNLNWNVWDYGYKAPTIYQWNAAIQHEISSNLALTVAYVGSSSNFLLESYNWNGSDIGPPATERQRRRIPTWNNINFRAPFGQANYHGMDVQVERRYSSGLYLSSAYTWSHSIDNIPEQFGPGGGGLMDFRNIASNRGNSNFDVRHRFIGSFAYELPIGTGKRLLNTRGVLNAIVGGWELSSLLSLQTGNYFTITVPNPLNRLGASGIGNWWPDRIRDPRVSERNTERWFDTSAFVLPRTPDGVFYLGNAGRAILNEDGLLNIDLGLKKSFPIGESRRIQFRWETFNLTNTPTLGTPETNIESPDFGKVRATVSTPRQMQFALRFEF
jgi:hypothetical protein